MKNAISFAAVLFLVITVTPGSASNILVNGTLDQNLSGWVMSYGFVKIKWERLNARHSGIVSVRNEAPTMTEAVAAISQCVKINSDEEYKIGAEVMIPREQITVGFGIIALTWYGSVDCDKANRNSETNLGSVSSPPITNPDGLWHTTDLCDLNPPAAAKSAEVQIVIGKTPGPSAFLLYADNLFVNTDSCRSQ